MFAFFRKRLHYYLKNALQNCSHFIKLSSVGYERLNTLQPYSKRSDVMWRLAKRNPTQLLRHFTKTPSDVGHLGLFGLHSETNKQQQLSTVERLVGYANERQRLPNMPKVLFLIKEAQQQIRLEYDQYERGMSTPGASLAQ